MIARGKGTLKLPHCCSWVVLGTVVFTKNVVYPLVSAALHFATSKSPDTEFGGINLIFLNCVHHPPS